jgi:hypothetical protein
MCQGIQCTRSPPAGNLKCRPTGWRGWAGLFGNSSGNFFRIDPMTEPSRRFPAPWRPGRVPGGYVVRDATRQIVARVYRRGNDHTDRAPAIAEALMALRVKSVTIDGEGMVCGPDDLTDFNRLRAARGRKGSSQAFLYAFELLELDGIDLRREPWETRQATLASLLRKSADGIRLCEHIEGTDGTTIFGHTCRMGLEGIVAKLRDVSVRAVPGLDQGLTERPSIGRYTSYIQTRTIRCLTRSGPRL